MAPVLFCFSHCALHGAVPPTNMNTVHINSHKDVFLCPPELVLSSWQDWSLRE